jgi:tetratricopeptide (TPR) repeat protein
MTRAKVLMVAVLILVLGLTGFSKEQTDTAEKVDELLGKFIEYFIKKDIDNAINCLQRAVELDPTKNVYIETIEYWAVDKYAEALTLLGQRKDHAIGEKERKVQQILVSRTHSLWAEDLEKKYLYREAIAHYEAAYAIDIVYRPGNAAVYLNNIGFVYDALGQKQKALENYEKALPMFKEVGYRAGEAAVLNNIGILYYTIGQNQDAMEYYEKSLSIVQEIGDNPMEALLLANLMVTWNDLNKRSLAIFYGKRSVNGYQQLRQHISGLDKDIRMTYLKSREDTYRFLAELLVKAGRLPEAQYVLDMLKGEEYFAYIRRDRAATSSVYAPIDFTPLEKAWLEKHNTVMNDVTAAASQYHELYLKPEKTPADLQRLAVLEKTLTAGRKAYAEFLAGLKKTFFQYDATIIKGSPETPANLIVYLDGVLRYLPLPALWDGRSFLVQRYRLAVLPFPA